MTNIIFATGCDRYYVRSWFHLYKSIKKYIPSSCIYFYDLGLNPDEIDDIKKLDIHYNYFDFSQYPDWVNIKNDAGQWAWKAQIVKSVMNRYKISMNEKQYLFWCDSRNQIDNSLSLIINFIEKNGIYTDITSGKISTWTVNQTIEYLNAFNYIDMPMRNAALQCFNISVDWVRRFIDEYASLSLIKDCIFPLGSSRRNHRQDQSILSILYYKYKDIHCFNDGNFYGGIRTHTGSDIVRPYHPLSPT
jgi:hypothetical protein